MILEPVVHEYPIQLKQSLPGSQFTKSLHPTSGLTGCICGDLDVSSLTPFRGPIKASLPLPLFIIF
jgi:hypothetical protein